MKSKLHLVLTSSSRYALVILILLAMPREDLKYMPTNNTAAEYKSRSTHVPAPAASQNQGVVSPRAQRTSIISVHGSRVTYVY